MNISVGLQSGTLLAWGSFLQDAADGFRMYWPQPQISTVESRSKELLLRLGGELLSFFWRAADALHAVAAGSGKCSAQSKQMQKQLQRHTS